MEVFEGFDESTLDFHLGWSDDESVYTTEKRKGGGRLVSILSRVKRRFEQRILVLTNAQPLLIATLSSCDSRVCNNQTNLDNSYRTVSTHRQNMRARQNSTPKGNIPSLTIIVTVIKMFVNWIEKTKTTKHTPNHCFNDDDFFITINPFAVSHQTIPKLYLCANLYGVEAYIFHDNIYRKVSISGKFGPLNRISNNNRLDGSLVFQ